MPNENFSALKTETQNPNTLHIDSLPAADVVRLIHREDHTVADAVDSQLDKIAQVAEMARDSIQSGGRLIYLGAGTSGRLGVLDASECRPTFGVPDGVVIGLIAGGERAMFQAVEGAEDSLTLGGEDLRKRNAGPKDTVIGIASSGRTPYVIGALTYARTAGCKTASISCVPDAAISKLADVPIEAVTGPEALTGSTRMKAGTAQKMILNMISTSAFILCGKSYGNLMVDVQPTNEKLVARAIRILCTSLECGEQKAFSLFEASGRRVKTAIVMGLCDCQKEDAELLLASHGDRIADAVAGFDSGEG